MYRRGQPDRLGCYADVLTLLSEAIVRKGNAVTSEALDLLNQVRVRAKLNPYTMGDVKGVDDFLQKVLDERGHELWFEGVRRSDLIRHGQFIQNARDRGCTTTKDEFVLFPLPQAVINEGTKSFIEAFIILLINMCVRVETFRLKIIYPIPLEAIFKLRKGRFICGLFSLR